MKFDTEKVKITEKEYFFFRDNIDNDVFNLFFSCNKDLVKEEVNFDNNKDIEYLSIFLSPENKDILISTFHQGWIDEKFNIKNETWRKVKQQINDLNEIIKPVLAHLGIEYKLYLTGGALRDFILNKEDFIKDIDVVLEFDDHFKTDKINGRNFSEKVEKQHDLIVGFLETNKTFFKNLGVFNIDFQNLSREYLLNQIVLKTLEKEQKEKNIKSMSSFKDLEQDYPGLFSVIKVNNLGSYDLDIMLTENKSSYINRFDFDICKCSYYINGSVSNSDSNVNYNHLFFAKTAYKDENLYLDDGFIFDVVYKQLSLNSNIFYNKTTVESCLNNHYLRLKDKYNYDVFVKNISDKVLLDYIEKSVIFAEYNYKFKPLEHKKTEKKNKI